jgi:hypothetical protein
MINMHGNGLYAKAGATVQLSARVYTTHTLVPKWNSGLSVAMTAKKQAWVRRLKGDVDA